VRGARKPGDEYGYFVIANDETFLDYRINSSL